MPPIMISIAISLAISIAIRVLTTLLTPAPASRPPTQQALPPTSSDGKFNFKQNVPSLTVVLGRVKKGGDYVFLEERAGVAYHVMVWAGHRIEGFVQHYLHDETATVVAGAVTAPSHFVYQGVPYVGIAERLGLDVQTSVGLQSVFPELWTVDHRGDGLACVLLSCVTINQENYFAVYPQQMPVHTAVGDGALVFDPREAIPGGTHDPDDPSTWAFSANLALLRLHQLTQPWGFKLTLADMYLPEWSAAADVCDEEVANREGDPEPRYHGGLWFRYENDPVDIGRTLDHAGELVVYERADGTIGVHAGEMVTPDIRLTADDILEFQYDANRRAASTVLAVRGRFTDPEAAYNTVDAAIWGDPYPGDDNTERTKTVDNAAVQRHNHCQRLQKIAFLRAAAARVKITIGYDSASTSRLVAYRRFVRVHLPGRGLDEAVVEITGRPKLSLANLTISFDGIVVPATLYSFNAATEEGVPGGAVATIVPGGVPEPTGFTVGIASESLAGGASAAFALAAWDYLSDALTYELEYQLADESEVPRSVMSKAGETEARTGYLQDGAEYRFRLRAWSNQVASDWTDYETATATADASAPGQPVDFNSTKAGSDVTLDWTNPNSPNLYRTVLYRNSANNFATAVAIFTAYGGIAEARTYQDSALAAGTYYWWVRSFNASAVASTQVGPTTKTI